MDKATLKRNRIFMGFGYILHHSEEGGLGGTPSKIIRSLGGDDRHIGIFGMANGVASMAQFLGAYILRWKNSNLKAMVFTMFMGAFFALLVAATLYLGNNGKSTLYLFLLLGLIFCGIGGIQLNVESSWIGDMVPKNMMGWFTSLKWVFSIVGMLVFSLLIAKIGENFPHKTRYAAIFIMFAVSFLIAAFVIYPRVTDQTPKCINYFSSDKENGGSLNYKSPPFWCYVSYYVSWSIGRGMMTAFTSIYYIDYFKLKLVGIAWLNNIQLAASIIMVIFFGKISDKYGNRKPLLLVTVVIAISMLLFTASAWFGLFAVIISLTINGFAGVTHSMLAINYAIEIFPDKGRSAYLGLSRVFIGAGAICGPALGGLIAYYLKDFSMELHGGTLVRYHAVFLTGTIIVLTGLIPLLWVRDRKVKEILNNEKD